MSGKGSARRPLSVDEQTFNNNFDAIFGKKKLNIVDKKEEEWDEKRIDTIGSNGDGFPLKNHYDEVK